MTTAPAVRAAVRIEEEVVYGYGVVGARLRGPDRQLATQRLAAHRQLRDQLRALGVDAPTAAPAYALPFPVIDAATAIRLAIGLEDAAARAAAALIASSLAGSAGRQLAVQMLTGVATAAARWRQRAGRSDDPAFPGQPAAAAASQPSTTPTTSPSSSTTASGSTS